MISMVQIIHVVKKEQALQSKLKISILYLYKIQLHSINRDMLLSLYFYTKSYGFQR